MVRIDESVMRVSESSGDRDQVKMMKVDVLCL